MSLRSWTHEWATEICMSEQIWQVFASAWERHEIPRPRPPRVQGKLRKCPLHLVLPNQLEHRAWESPASAYSVSITACELTFYLSQDQISQMTKFDSQMKKGIFLKWQEIYENDANMQTNAFQVILGFKCYHFCQITKNCSNAKCKLQVYAFLTNADYFSGIPAISWVWEEKPSRHLQHLSRKEQITRNGWDCRILGYLWRMQKAVM